MRQYCGYCSLSPKPDVRIDTKRLLDEINAYIVAEVSTPFWKLLFAKKERVRRIDGFQNQIHEIVTTLQVCSSSKLAKHMLTHAHRQA